MFLLALAGLATDSSPSPLERWVEAEMKSRHIPGMAVGVFQYGKPLQIVTRGYADLENKVKVRRQTQFEICSITKQVTAAAVLLLVQDGKMRLSDPIGKHLPGIPESWAGVTVRNLLDHTSGVPDKIFADNLTALPFSEALKKLASYPLAYQPGERWSYNNTGYWLVGHAIEAASKEDYFSFLQHRIFTPLKMKHTFPNRESQLVPWRSRGYKFVNGKIVNASPLTDHVGYAAGGLISTIDDLNIWSQALVSNKLLTEGSRREMLTASKLRSGIEAWNYAGGGYGLGVFVGDLNGHRVEKHSGGWDDASCQLTRFLDNGFTVVVLTNVGFYEQRSFAGEKIGHLFVPSIRPPKWSKESDPEPALTEKARKLISDVASHAPNDGQAFSGDCRERILANLEHMDTMVGSEPLHTLEFFKRIPQGETTINLYKVKFKRPLIALLAFDKDHQVTDFQLLEPPDS